MDPPTASMDPPTAAEDLPLAQELPLAEQLAQLKAVHSAQIAGLEEVIAEERNEHAAAKAKFETVLRAKYDNLVASLRERVEADNEARVQRAILDLEKAARLESERSRQAFEAQSAAEATLSSRFKSVVADLRKSWEEEEVIRAQQLEERLRSHYSTVLEHMEAQLVIALQLRGAADQRWAQDVSDREAKQVAVMRAFENKCRLLYDGRLSEYLTKSEQQLAQYERELLDIGSNFAKERDRVEGRQRRMQLSAHKWKIQFQKEVDARYREMTAKLETRYMDEIHKLLQEIARLQTKRDPHAANVAFSESTVPPQSMAVSDMRLTLQQLGASAGFSAEDILQMLGSLLDAASPSALVQVQYDDLLVNIAKRKTMKDMASRRDTLEAKIRLLQQKGGDVVGNLDAREDLSSEVSRIRSLMDSTAKTFQSAFFERSPLKNIVHQGIHGVPKTPTISKKITSNSAVTSGRR